MLCQDSTLMHGNPPKQWAVHDCGLWIAKAASISNTEMVNGHLRRASMDALVIAQDFFMRVQVCDALRNFVRKPPTGNKIGCGSQCECVCHRPQHPVCTDESDPHLWLYTAHAVAGKLGCDGFVRYADYALLRVLMSLQYRVQNYDPVCACIRFGAIYRRGNISVLFSCFLLACSHLHPPGDIN